MPLILKLIIVLLFSGSKSPNIIILNKQTGRYDKITSS